MARNPVSRAQPCASNRTKQLVITKLHVPTASRRVTARKLGLSAADRREHGPRREVPEIRLSGEWLARVGFPKGRRYLISADRAFETIYLQAEASSKRKTRR